MRRAGFEGLEEVPLTGQTGVMAARLGGLRKGVFLLILLCAAVEHGRGNPDPQEVVDEQARVKFGGSSQGYGEASRPKVEMLVGIMTAADHRNQARADAAWQAWGDVVHNFPGLVGRVKAFLVVGYGAVPFAPSGRALSHSALQRRSASSGCRGPNSQHRFLSARPDLRMIYL